jgi:hypothetical protein
MLIGKHHWRITCLYCGTAVLFLGGHQTICYGEFLLFVNCSQDRMLQQIDKTYGFFPCSGKGSPILLWFVSVRSSQLIFVFFCNEWEKNYFTSNSFFFFILTSSFHGGCRGLWLGTHTSRTPLDKGLARRRDLYLKIITLIRDIHVPAGLEHSAAADTSLRLPATGISVEDIIENKSLFVFCCSC